jgi:ectoine hydroxylase-related dioxygenase (phytanoyl-CoA dioxygenase family)
MRQPRNHEEKPVLATTDREQTAREYRHAGYLTVGEFLDADLLAAARAETLAICRAMGPAGESDDDEAVLRRYLCVHFPHKVSELMRDIARHPAAVRALTEVIGPNVKMMQSMLFVKSAGKPGQAWHQDETHIPTRDRSLTAIWIALDDATVDNGCLWVIPGSHRSGVLHPDRDQHDARFDCTREAYGFSEADAVPVELTAGAAFVFDGHLLHRSLPNTARRGTRRALVNHYMSAESLLPWFPPGAAEPMGTLDHRDILLVAGTDPYGFKGTTDVMRPHIRPDGDGGCVR